MVYISTHGHIYMYTYHYMSGYMLCVNAVVPSPSRVSFHFHFTHCCVERLLWVAVLCGGVARSDEAGISSIDNLSISIARYSPTYMYIQYV